MKKDSDAVQATMKCKAIDSVRDMMRRFLYSVSRAVPKYQASKSVHLLQRINL